MLPLILSALLQRGRRSASGETSRGAQFLQHVAAADHVIDLSEGDSFTDMYGVVRLVYQSLPRLVAISLGKRIVFFPQTYGPFSTAMGRAVARWLFSRARFVFTREHASTEAMQAYVPAEKLIELSDMAFLMAPQPPAETFKMDLGMGFVGVNVSGLLYHADDNPKYGWSSATYRSFTREVVVKFVRDFGRPVVLIPHVYAPGDRTDDIAACESLYDLLPPEVQSRVRIVRETLWAPQIKHVIGQSAFFLGARMHSCIAAAASGVPTVPVSYSHKFQGVFGQLGLKELVCNPAQMGQEEMLARVEQIYGDSEQVRLKLIAATNQARARAMAAVEYL